MSENIVGEITDSQGRKSAMILNFAAFNQLRLKDLKKLKTDNKVLRNFTREQVNAFMENPSKNEKQLRDISITLYNKSTLYKRLIQYFSGMLRLDYIVEPYNIDPAKVNKKTLLSQYYKILNFLDVMNIKHEFSKILNVAFREDVFFGYEHYANDTYFIQRLNPDYCMISSIEDGCFNFAYDFSYFANNLEKLETFPKEFKSKYNKYLNDSSLRWQELDSTKTVCIKINEDLDYNLPPFASVFEGLFDISDFKALRKDKQEIQNYKVLIQKLPIREDSEDNNDFMIDFDNMMMFHNKAAEALPDQVALITTPMDITDINFEKDSVDSDNVEKATSEFWSNTGVTLFDGINGSAGLEASIKNDETIVFAVLRQIERWINRRIKFYMRNANFKISMPNLTENNHLEVHDSAKSAAEFGMPTKMLALAALGMSPTSVITMTFLENEMLGLVDKFIPLQSAHTLPNDDEGGAPTKKASKLTDEGSKSRDK